MDGISQKWAIMQHESYKLALAIQFVERKNHLRMYPSTKVSTTNAMKPFCEGLRILKLFGLPLKISERDDGSIIFKDSLRWIKCGTILCKESKN